MLILDKLITLTIEEVKMYPSVQAKIWGNIGMLQYVCQPLEIACATPHIAYGVRYIYLPKHDLDVHLMHSIFNRRIDYVEYLGRLLIR